MYVVPGSSESRRNREEKRHDKALTEQSFAAIRPRAQGLRPGRCLWLCLYTVVWCFPPRLVHSRSLLKTIIMTIIDSTIMTIIDWYSRPVSSSVCHKTGRWVPCDSSGMIRGAHSRLPCSTMAILRIIHAYLTYSYPQRCTVRSVLVFIMCVWHDNRVYTRTFPDIRHAVLPQLLFVPVVCTEARHQ